MTVQAACGSHSLDLAVSQDGLQSLRGTETSAGRRMVYGECRVSRRGAGRAVAVCGTVLQYGGRPEPSVVFVKVSAGDQTTAAGRGGGDNGVPMSRQDSAEQEEEM